MRPGFDSRPQRHMWVEFVVGSLLASRGFSPCTPVFPSPQKPTLPNSNSIRNALIYEKVSSRLLYNAFQKRKQVPPSAQKKMNEKFLELQVSWKEIYSLPFVVTIETKIREFQYKILNNIVFTNEKLFRLKMIDSPLCGFVKEKLNPSSIYFSFVR